MIIKPTILKSRKADFSKTVGKIVEYSYTGGSGNIFTMEAIE